MAVPGGRGGWAMWGTAVGGRRLDGVVRATVRLLALLGAWVWRMGAFRKRLVGCGVG